ncbi:MAG: amidohydrolase family protein [Actinomycetota bacterium]|nr:amidohydrolase family protein [Actinomycetota bacterium]
MIIDCHGHYTTAPPQLGAYRDAQKAALAADPDHVGAKGAIDISDDELAASLEPNQLRLQRERGIDLTLFSPRASWMGHHIGNAHTSRYWTEHCNDLIARICELYPDNFAPVCQLPQSPGAPIDASVRELRRCVEMGFVGANLNPDPSGGLWNGPTLDDPAFRPLYEALCELDVPAMIHVSATCNPHFHSTGSHYLGADTTAFMQALTSGLFRDFPSMRWVIPHGGGAVPYHWGRFKGMAEEQGWQHLDELLGNVFFDTCVYHQPGIDLLVGVVPTDNVLFASEMVGAVKGRDPNTGEFYDDTKRYVEAADLTDDQRHRIFEANARRVYPRLDARLDAGATT